MSIFKNRTVIGVICILLALVICFGITPLFNQSISQKAEIVRVTKDIYAGELITRDMVTTAEVGSYNLPSGILREKDSVVGKYAKADLAVGDYILAAKLSDAPAAENAYLYNLDGTKQAISVTIKSFATGLSGKLQSGDIVSVIVADYPEDGETTIPAELQYVEIISVTASTGYDANTGEATEEEKELPSTVTFLVLPEQTKVLAELEQVAKLHLALVYRGHAGERGDRMNFRKASIFQRDTEKPEEQNDSGGMLAVWGSPGSGKTVTAAKIAKILSARKKNVILLLCDMAAPMLPCICPADALESNGSLAGVLAAARISENLIKHNLVTFKRNSCLAVLGLLERQNEYSTPPFTQKQVVELLDGLRQIAPYVIVDCGSYIANDILSAVALMEADSILRLANCEPKSVNYFASQLPLLDGPEWDMDKQYKVAANVKPFQAADHIGKVLGDTAFVLPYSQELEEQYLAGNLLADLALKDSRPFRKELERIIAEVF